MGTESERTLAELQDVASSKRVKEAIVCCPIHLIEDAPSETDQFASSDGIGPHERVAKALVEVILSPEESGGKMIALEGDWGAGKTTVIGLLKKKLAGEAGITVFSYDAWAHESDPLRRTFLESLIRHFQALGKKGWINKENSTKVLDTLANRRKVTKTGTIPKVTSAVNGLLPNRSRRLIYKPMKLRRTGGRDIYSKRRLQYSFTVSWPSA